MDNPKLTMPWYSKVAFAILWPLFFIMIALVGYAETWYALERELDPDEILYVKRDNK
jgi:hypothetical protein